MTEIELQERFCANCERPDCMKCAAFAAHYESEDGDHDVDPAACDYYEDDDIDVPSLTERERYELQCDIEFAQRQVANNTRIFTGSHNVPKCAVDAGFYSRLKDK